MRKSSRNKSRSKRKNPLLKADHLKDKKYFTGTVNFDFDILSTTFTDKKSAQKYFYDALTKMLDHGTTPNGTNVSIDRVKCDVWTMSEVKGEELRPAR